MNWFNTSRGFFAGTYNAHPLPSSAALATIQELESALLYDHMLSLGENIRKGL